MTAPSARRAFAALAAVILATCSLGSARANVGQDITGVWEAETPRNAYQLRVSWNPQARRFEGFLVRLGELSQRVGFTVGELCWIATPTSNPAVMQLDEELRSGANGVSTRATWRRGVVRLDRSSASELVTSTALFRRIDGPTPSSPSSPSSSSSSPPETRPDAPPPPQAAAPDDGTGMPSVEEVVNKVQGRDPADTLARQVGAFTQLERILNTLPKDPTNPRATANLMRAYMEARGRASRQLVSPGDKALAARYERDDGFRQQMMGLISGRAKQTLAARQQAAEAAQQAAADAAEKKARVAQEQKKADEDRERAAAEVTAAEDAVIASAVAKEAADHKTGIREVFGIPLGKPLRLPACIHLDEGGYNVKERCQESNQIRFPAHELPTWLEDGRLGSLDTVVKGSLLVAVVITNLAQSDEVYVALTKKYGKPTKFSKRNFANGYGIESQGEDWEWRLPDLHVEFSLDNNQRVVSDRFGTLTIEVESYRKARAAKSQADDDKRVKF